MPDPQNVDESVTVMTDKHVFRCPVLPRLPLLVLLSSTACASLPVQVECSWLWTSGPADWALVIVGTAAAIAALKTLGGLKRQIDLTRESILKTHRPKIVVREIDITELQLLPRTEADGTRRDDISTAYTAIQANVTELTGSFRITNIGTTAATITYGEAVIYLGTERLPAQNPCSNQPLNQLNRKPRLLLSPGTTTRLDFPRRQITGSDFTDIRAGRTTLWVMGKIIYADELSNSRRTGFTRRFNRHTGRFEIVDDEPDYEYVD